MALLFIDSFDHYATADLAAKWTVGAGAGLGTNTVLAAAGGRRSSGGLQSSAASGLSVQPLVSKTLAPGDATLIAGFAYKPGVVAADYPLFTVGDNTAYHCGVYGTATGALNVRRGPNYTGTVLGTTSAALPTGSFTYIEIKITISDTVGVVIIRFNGTTVLSLSSVDTKDAPLLGWTQVGWHTLHNGGTAQYLDDVYVLDGTGAAPGNAFLGDVRVDARVPTGAGATTAWTPSAGANYTCVDDAAPNGDTDYVSTTTVGATDTYALQDVAVPGATIYGVQHCLNLKKLDAGACSVAPVIRVSGTDYPGADLAPTTSYAYGLQIAAVNPGTGAAWTESGFNAAEFGMKKTA
jgi:hypothetical protein